MLLGDTARVNLLLVFILLAKDIIVVTRGQSTICSNIAHFETF